MRGVLLAVLLAGALLLWAGARFIADTLVRPAPYIPVRTESSQSSRIEPLSTFLPWLAHVYEPSSPTPTPQQLSDPEVQAAAAGLVNMTLRQTLWSSHADNAEGIASLTKLMTSLVAREYATSSMLITIEQDDLNVDSVNKDLRVGDRFTLDEAFHFLLIPSDNAMAKAVARTVFHGGSQAFVKRMNQTAAALGMTHTSYEDPVGLGRDVSSVSDLAILARYIENNYPDLFSFSKYAHLTMVTEQGRVFELNNTNQILNQIPGIIGSKTGYTPETGGSLLVVFETQKGKFVSIVLGSPDRFGDTSAILSWYSRAMSDTLNANN